MMPQQAETGRPNDDLVKKWQMKAIKHKQGMSMRPATLRIWQKDSYRR